jgi:hypothetical protein
VRPLIIAPHPRSHAPSRYGAERLTANAIEKIVQGSEEPMMIPKRRWLTYAQIAIIVATLPWYRTAYSDQEVTYGGFPEWAAWFFSAIVICYAIQMYCIWSWTPNDTPIEGLHYGGCVGCCSAPALRPG